MQLFFMGKWAIVLKSLRVEASCGHGRVAGEGTRTSLFCKCWQSADGGVLLLVSFSV